MHALYEKILKDYLPFYNDFELDDKESILEGVFLRKFYNGEQIVDEDFFNRLDCLMIIVKGSANILAKNGDVKGTLKEGDFFGDFYPVYPNKYQDCLTVKSETMTALCFPEKISKTKFGMTFGKKIQMIHVLKAIKQDEILKDL